MCRSLPRCQVTKVSRGKFPPHHLEAFADGFATPSRVCCAGALQELGRAGTKEDPQFAPAHREHHVELIVTAMGGRVGFGVQPRYGHVSFGLVVGGQAQLAGRGTHAAKSPVPGLWWELWLFVLPPLAVPGSAHYQHQWNREGTPLRPCDRDDPPLGTCCRREAVRQLDV